jgi:hypothetical protein
MLKRLFCTSASTFLLTLLASRSALPGTLWLGNDLSGDVFHTDEVGSVIGAVPNTPVSGIAFDGTYLYFSNNVGNVSRRNANGASVGGDFNVPGMATLEDLAWDSVRGKLWGIEHNPARVHKIDASTGLAEITYAVPLVDSDPNLTPRGGLGIAYDCNRDLLYLSFCQVGCASLARGLVLVMDPSTGAIIGELFRTDGFATGGLGFDGSADALWVGDRLTVRKMTRTGAVLSNFARPQPGSFVDGLEFIGACEPTTAPAPSWGSIKRLYYR